MWGVPAVYKRACMQPQSLGVRKTMERIVSQSAMQTAAILREREPQFPLKKDQGLRRVLSDVPTMTTDTEKVIEALSTVTIANEVKTVECECCGMSEDCTPTYIGRIKEFYCGKWICGLCSEDVKEKMRKDPAVAVLEEAVESHMNFCKQFNKTTRLNPKLSLAGAMRDIARKSSQRRASSKGAFSSAIARTSSCCPRIC